MANNIDSMTNQYMQISARSSQPQGPEKPMDNSNQTAASNPATSGSADTIELTSDARLMQEVEQRLNSVSEVDSKRVDEIRSRIESGDYSVSAERTADKMISMDQSMPEDK